MNKRAVIVLGMGAGALWALALVGGPQLARLPYLPPALSLPGALFAPGLVMVLMVGRLAQRRFFDDDIIDGEPFVPGSGGDIDQRVLTNTVEQLLLALAIWPFVALTLGGFSVLFLGFGFAIARLIFWIGYHRAPALRGFGFAATFYPTLLAAIWSVITWLG